MKKLKIGYFADGPWSHLAFKKIISDKSIKIQFIVPRSDTNDFTLKDYARKFSIDYLVPKNINDQNFIDKISLYRCDLFVSMSFNQIFKKQIIGLTNEGIINCHAGKLPYYRGRNVLNWVLINDEQEFGITVHFVDEGIDTGDIILQKTFQINDQDNYSTLLEKAYTECPNILYESILLFKKGKVKSYKQNKLSPLGFYCVERKKGDEILDWNQTSREIFNFVRAISKPGPSAKTFINKKEIKINKVEIVDNAPKYKSITGAIISVSPFNFTVKTKDSYIKVTEFEFNGKIKIGDRFDF